MIQLWVNLPKKDKLTPPKYQALVASEMNKVVLPGDGGTVSVIAGKFNDVKGSASTFTEINVFDIRLNKNGEMTANIPATHNTAILVIEGSAAVNGQDAELHNFVLFKNEGETITIKAKKKCVAVIKRCAYQ